MATATDATLTEAQRRGALAHPDVELHEEVNRDILKMLSAPGKGWWFLFSLAVLGVGLLFGSWGWQIYRGIGVSGLTSPVGWGGPLAAITSRSSLSRNRNGAKPSPRICRM